MIHEEVISSYFRKMLAIVSFLWSAQLLYPVIFHWEVVHGVIGLDFWDAILVMVESSWFWSIIFFIPVLAHIISVYYQYMGRWVLVLEGMLGFFVWAVATIMFYIEYIPVSNEIHHVMQPFTPFAVMSGNLLVTWFAWRNMFYLWDITTELT